MDVIRTEGLTKHYTSGFWRPRPYAALQDLTLGVAQGEVFGFLGPNGAGKTTTLKLLMQLIYPTSGFAEILGKPVGDVSVRRRIGYLPENPYFYDNLTAEELLAYFARVFGYGPKDGRVRAARLLDEVGIGAERKFQLRKFSKGMVQRVGIAQALINEPEVVFLDEPMSGLDPIGRRDVRDLILRLRDQGRTIFFSSHVLSDAEALCSKVAVMAKGRLAASGRLADLLANQARAWELVISNVSQHLIDRVAARLTSVTPLGGGRYSLELPATTLPEPLLSELMAAGARLVSLNPVRETLEHFFVQQVNATDADRFVESRVRNRSAS
ncbi:MAG TPA: ABC transporter ATP-binding protein [Vicinamibacterales bacterium]|jgi:ABC-2 type transport system ATP-binding protein